MSRVRRRAFTDLALWMTGLGVAIGVMFPFVMVMLGVPSRFTLTPRFFLACVLAGVVLAGMNYALARRVVGLRLAALTQRMHYVAGVIGEATYSGDWGKCSPAECCLPVESDDELGEAARSFNQLISGLATSRDVQQAMTEMSKTLSEHLEWDDFCTAALRAWLRHGEADAGALIIVRDGEFDVAAVQRLQASRLDKNLTVQAAMSAAGPVMIDVPDDVLVDAVALSFRPRCIIVVPLRFRGVALGAVVLAFGAMPGPERPRLLGSFADPMAVALNNVMAHDRFQTLAALDPLTGAYNRRFGLQRLNEEWARANRTDGPLGVLTFDIDHFKAVNDDHGHLIGDRVIRQVATTARQSLRDGDVLVRMGGEEFLVILPGAGPNDVTSIGERMRRVISAAAVQSRGVAVRVTVSFGGACVPDSACPTSEDLLSMADDAMYASKRSGRDRLTMAQEAYQPR